MFATTLQSEMKWDVMTICQEHNVRSRHTELLRKCLALYKFKLLQEKCSFQTFFATRQL